MSFVDTLRADELTLTAPIEVEDPDRPGARIKGKVFQLTLIDPTDVDTLIRVYILRDTGSVTCVDLPQHANVIIKS